MAAALAGKRKKGGAGGAGRRSIRRRVAESIAGGLRSSVRALGACVSRLEDGKRAPAGRLHEAMAIKGALEKQVRELRGAPVRTHGELEKSRADRGAPAAGIRTRRRGSRRARTKKHACNTAGL